MSNEQATKRERAIAEACKAFDEAINATKECPRCNAAGYHHGFGEHGHDPDWCDECGGAAVVGAFTNGEAMEMAIAAYERVMAEPDAEEAEAHQRYLCRIVNAAANAAATKGPRKEGA